VRGPHPLGPPHPTPTPPTGRGGSRKKALGWGRPLSRRKVGRWERGARGEAVLLALLLGLGLAACSSPNRGTWKGEFQGDLAGVVQFTINSRGTKLSGTIEGTTSGGQPFTAEMEGKIHDPFFYGTFKGKGRTDVYPVPFDGLMRGELQPGRAKGDWEAQIRFNPAKMKGAWNAKQEVPPP
jgi:hypothetical protein